MRRVHRPDLPVAAQSYLDRRRQATAGQTNVDDAWNAARKARAMAAVVGALQRMAGACERCMYCVDSHGSDVEHFWPKSLYPDRAFEWINLLLCCTECGRIKGNRFPRSSTGEPMLVNPSVEDPWEFLDFDPDTGNLTARYETDSEAPSPRGEATVQALNLDRREGMAEGYRRTYIRLVACVRHALAADTVDPSTLTTDLQRADDHGLMGWCFGPVGAQLQPFAQLRREAPDSWAACIAATR